MDFTFAQVKTHLQLTLDTTPLPSYGNLMNDVLISGGLILAGFALRSFASIWLGRLGSIAILSGSYRAGLLLFHETWAGIIVALLWLLIPAVQVLWSARHYELPLDKKFRPRRPPPSEFFPNLVELTDEFIAEGFELVEDVGWQSEHWEQFSRLLVHSDRKLQGCIHFHTQGANALGYAALITRTEDGRQWTSWNYPYNPGLKLPPELILNRQPFAQNLHDLMLQHEEFIQKSTPATIVAPNPDHLVEMIQDELRRQIDHNLDAGLLRLSGRGHFMYSWRGALFVLRQFMIDLLRYS